MRRKELDEDSFLGAVFSNLISEYSYLFAWIVTGISIYFAITNDYIYLLLLLVNIPLCLLFFYGTYLVEKRSEALGGKGGWKYLELLWDLWHYHFYWQWDVA